MRAAICAVESKEIATGLKAASAVLLSVGMLVLVVFRTVLIELTAVCWVGDIMLLMMADCADVRPANANGSMA